MNVVLKLVFTVLMMLVWGVGKEVAQKTQGSGFGFLTLIVSIVCTWVIYDIWFGSVLFSKKSKLSDNSVANSSTRHSYSGSINEVTQSNSGKEHAKPIQIQKLQTIKKDEIVMTNNDLTQNLDVVNDEEFYLQATQEVDEKNQDKAQWAKCMALCEGDENKAKYKYIKERVDRLVTNEKNRIDTNKKLLTEQKEKKKQENEMRSISKYLNNYEMLNNLLNQNNYNFYKSKYGPYVFTQKGVDEPEIFATDLEFKNFITKLLPKLSGFDK